MSKGRQAKIGAENVAANGYAYVKTASGWRLKHHIVAEQKLGRPLEKGERVSFADNDRTNFDPANIIVATKQPKSGSTYGRRLHSVEEKMISFVEDSEDKWQALKDLQDALGDVRRLYGFSATFS